ncbi:MAG: methyl-accepting chemotaxis protein [Deltaproteobacteria bacterium]|nr:methyl-accepting chemotaxis protein [Deltaproteobacteria bacterium]
MKKMTLNLKLLLGGIALVLIPTLVIGLFSIHNATNALREASNRELFATAKGAAETIEAAMRAEIAMVKEIASGNTVVDVATLVSQSGNRGLKEVENISRRLANTMKQIGGQYENIILTDLNGTIVADGVNGPKDISLADREYFKTAKSGTVNVGPAVKSKKTGNPIVCLASPVKSPSGEIVGVVTVLLKADALLETIAGTKVGKTGYAFTVDKEGTAIAHPKKELILSANLRKLKGMESITERVLCGQQGVESYRFDGVDKTAGFAPVPVAGWYVITTLDNAEFLAPVHSMRNWILTMGAVILALSAVTVIFFARSVSKPITTVVEGLGDGAEQVASASCQVSSASQQLAEGASEQAAAIEETSSSLEEVSSMIKQNAENAGEANRLMEEAKRIVERASQSMGQLTSSMEEISTASQDTQKIIKTIDEIAFQTNLLALNAAVEAARAGEAGAGFAVVADEVRNLALRAADAAKNTAGLIEATVKKVKEGSESLITTNREFVEIATSVNRSGDLVGEIAAASSEQAQGIQQISHAVAEMEKVVQQNSATAEESAAAAEEMNAQAEQMKVYVAGLTALVRGSKNVRTGPTKTSMREETTKKWSTKALQTCESNPRALTKPAVARSNDNGAPHPSLRGSVRQVSPEEMIPFDGEDLKDF